MIALNARPLTLMLAGFRPPVRWTRAEFAAKGVSLIKGIHRIATAVRAKAAAGIRRDVQREIESAADDITERARAVIGGKAAGEGAVDLSRLWSQWDALVDEALKHHTRALERKLGKPAQSLADQGHSKMAVLMASVRREAGESARMERAASVSRSHARAIAETTGKQAKQAVRHMSKEGFKGDGLRQAVGKVLRKKAKARARTAGRTLANDAWHIGAIDAMKEAGVTAVSVMGCTSREWKYWDRPWYRDFMWPPEGGEGDGREPESCCNIHDVPIEFAHELNWHPNHTGTMVPSSVSDIIEDVRRDIM